MGLLRYALLLFAVLLFVQVVAATETRVLYFYHPLSSDSQAVEKDVIRIRERWKDKVLWIDHDFKKNSTAFEYYNIFSLPVALVQCSNQSIRVGRSDNFTSNLDTEIEGCVSEQENKEIGKDKGISKEVSKETCVEWYCERKFILSFIIGLFLVAVVIVFIFKMF